MPRLLCPVRLLTWRFLSDHPGSFHCTQPPSLVLTLEQELRLQKKEFSSVTQDVLSVLCKILSLARSLLALW